MFESYTPVLAALFVMLATMLLQTIVATAAHRRQKHYIPGVINESLGHESFVFRSHRTYQNSLANVPLMVLTSMLAILAGVDMAVLQVMAWIYALARIMHMILYYVIATEKNPSPRSYFYAIALLTNLGLVLVTGAKLLGIN